MRVRLLLLPVVLVSMAVHAGADELPVRKPGLWEIVASDKVATRRRARPVAVQQCTSAEVDLQMLLSVAPGQENCQSPEVVRNAEDSYSVQTRCSVHGNAVETQFALTGDLQSAYQGHYESRFENAPSGKRDDGTRAQRFEARWLGACPVDMRPGDVRLPIGVLVNVLQTHLDEHEH